MNIILHSSLSLYNHLDFKSQRTQEPFLRRVVADHYSFHVIHFYVSGKKQLNGQFQLK